MKDKAFFKYYYSIIHSDKTISEQDYKKELAMFRLGIIKCPQLSIYLKDYGYDDEL